MRLWGSIAFILAGYLAGLLFERTGLEILPFFVAGTSLLVVAAALILPRDIEDRASVQRPTVAEALQLARRPPLMTMICGVGMVQAGHAVFYSLATIHWLRLGYSEGTIALLWAAGVAAEVVFLWYVSRLEVRFGLWGLAILAAAGGAVRWTITAFGPPLGVLFSMQFLHALGFAAAHVTAVRYIGREVVPPSGRHGPGREFGPSRCVHGGRLVVKRNYVRHRFIGSLLAYDRILPAGRDGTDCRMSPQPHRHGEGGCMTEPSKWKPFSRSCFNSRGPSRSTTRAR